MSEPPMTPVEWHNKETDDETFEKESIEFEKEVEREKTRILRNLNMRYWR